ncbi:MAG: hypothetical protein HFH14_01110 [Lachnospiraceae bacterium]|nr:hypothetical protein [Lachnospiraceae bacterium]
MCKNIVIGCFDKEDAAVKCAVNNLKKDIETVTDCPVSIRRLDIKDAAHKDAGECDILIATKDVHTWLDGEEALDRWEGYVVKKQDGRVYICGADRRGTIYGIYELSQYIGVSPWYYFADVPIRKKSGFIIPDGYYISDYPSVQYRGIFLNDEEELEEWAALHTSDGTIGPELYRKIFELILRLKGNYIWPAMHVNYFQENPENARLANEMGIVVGTSHCDMLMRSNQNEWNPWLRSKGYRSDYNAVHSNKLQSGEADGMNGGHIYYDYSIPGKNREVIREYWRESVEMNRDYEVCYTIGMRGVHDYGFSTRMIDEDDSLSDEEKEKARIRLLETIMSDQRDMLKEGLGLASAAEVLQAFIPYKEVLDLYDKDLNVPEDVTLIWANDNFGHIRRYPNEEERKRRGGHGLYYHASYWAAPDMSYLFFNTIPLAHMTQELKKAYESGIRKMWVLNVGALKPLEMDMEAFLQYGWDAGKSTRITTDIHGYTAAWFDKYFSGEYGNELADLYEAFAQLTNARKIEHMAPLVFSQTGYGDEAGERVCRLEYIFNRANAIYEKLPDCEKTAFFEMFLFKVHASYYVNHAFYYADRSILSYDRGNDRAADFYTDNSYTMMQYLRNMLQYYNKYMCGGKWDGILTPDSFPPPGICFYPVCKPSIRRKSGGLKLFLPDGGSSFESGSIMFCSGGLTKKWFELGNQGARDIDYTITICGSHDWLAISETEGTVVTEKRIYLTVPDMSLCEGKSALLKIKGSADEKVIELNVTVEQPAAVTAGIGADEAAVYEETAAAYDNAAACGKIPAYEETIAFGEDTVMEADGAVCLFADRYQYETGADDGACWKKVYGVGRGFGNVMTAYCADTVSPESPDIMKNPCLGYSFFLKNEGEFELEIIRFLTLNARGRIRFAVGIDRKEPVIIESAATDEWRGAWKESVLNNGEKLNIRLPFLQAGRHTLQLYMIDRYVSIHKMVLYTEEKKDTFFGFSSIHYCSDMPSVNMEELDALQKDMYMASDNDIVPDVVYADKEFWKYNRIYMKNDTIKRAAPGVRRYADYYYGGVSAAGNSENSITDMFGSGVFQEKDGILSLEAEYALEDSDNAYLTPDKTGGIYWSHARARTDGGTGLAMMVFGPHYTWDNPKDAPGMHFRVNVTQSGNFNAWLLVLFEDHMSDTCYFAVDGEVLPLSSQYRNGQLFNYSTMHIYFWCLTGNIRLEEGEHTFSIYAGDSGMQIDRIYLSRGDELPPLDNEWKSSNRRD